MKFIMCLLLITLTAQSTHPIDSLDIFSKIDDQEIIKKIELEEQFNIKLSEFGDDFIGRYITTAGDIKAGIIEGVKNDTLFYLLIVVKRDSCLSIRQHPYASFYSKDNNIKIEYMLGSTYATCRKGDTICIRAYFETYVPYKVDTMKDMFNASSASILHTSYFDFCL